MKKPTNQAQKQHDCKQKVKAKIPPAVNDEEDDEEEDKEEKTRLMQWTNSSAAVVTRLTQTMNFPSTAAALKGVAGLSIKENGTMKKKKKMMMKTRSHRRRILVMQRWPKNFSLL